MVKENNDIRRQAREAKVPLWAIAEEIGISEATLTRRMRLKLCDADKRELADAIERIVKREGKANENENNS